MAVRFSPILAVSIGRRYSLATLVLAVAGMAPTDAAAGSPKPSSKSGGSWGAVIQQIAGGGHGQGQNHSGGHSNHHSGSSGHHSGSSGHHSSSQSCWPKYPSGGSCHTTPHYCPPSSGPIYTTPVIVTTPAPVDPVFVDPGSVEAPSVPRNQLPGGQSLPGQPAADGTARRQEILIANPPQNQADVSYLIDQRLMTTPAGQMQTIAAASVVVTYDRGGQNGQASFTLSSGSYEFEVGPNGWQIFRKTFKVRLGNPGVVEEFRFVLDGKPMSLKAGQAMNMQADFPIQLTFDRGSGEPATRPLIEGEYMLRLDESQRTLDVVSVAQNSAQSPNQGPVADRSNGVPSNQLPSNQLPGNRLPGDLSQPMIPGFSAPAAGVQGGFTGDLSGNNVPPAAPLTGVNQTP